MADKIYSGTLIDILHEVERQGKDAFTEDELDRFISDIFREARSKAESFELRPVATGNITIH